MTSEELFKKALEAAYRFLALRSHSCMEIRAKLKRKGFAAPLIEEIIKLLLHQKYLDDQDIALRWARQLVEYRGWGKAKIKQYLFQKGISREIIEDASNCVWNEFDEEAVARKALRKKIRFSKNIPQKTKQAAFLKTRGFSMEIICKVLGGFD